MLYPTSFGTKYALVSYQDPNGKKVQYTIPIENQDAMAKALKREKANECTVRSFVWMYFPKSGHDSIDVDNFLITSGSKKLSGAIVIHDARNYELLYLHPKMISDPTPEGLSGLKMGFPLKISVKKYCKVVFFEVSEVLEDGNMLFLYRELFIRSIKDKKVTIDEAPGKRHAVGKIEGIPLWRIIRKKIAADLEILNA